MKRFSWYIFTYPLVFKRWIFHLLWPLFPKWIKNSFPPESLMEWFLDLIFYTIDLCFIPPLYESALVLLKPGSRKLSEHELELARSIFGRSLRYDLIRIDPAPWFISGKILAWVTFSTIHCKKEIADHILIHELVHVWQFQHFGSVYMSKSLIAHLRAFPYNYGGKENLYQQMLRGKGLVSFNFEQQAEIVEDYYKSTLHKTEAPMFGNVLGYFAAQLQYPYK